MDVGEKRWRKRGVVEGGLKLLGLKPITLSSKLHPCTKSVRNTHMGA